MGWLSEEVHAIMEEVRKKKEPVPLKEKVRKLALPDWKTVKAIVFLLIISIPFSWFLATWNPRVLCFGNEERFLSIYTTMWQVQAGIAAIALPILLFVIELSKDERQAATRSHEVLIRETWIFPIITFALAGTFRTGFDIVWFPKEIVFLMDFILVFLGTLVFAVFAYFSALRLLFSPARMKKRAMTVVREKMNESLDASIEIRIANNRLFAKMEELKIGFWPFSPERDEAERYLALRAPNVGILADIHLGKLEEFIRGLPCIEPVKATVVTGRDPEADEARGISERQRQDNVWLMKRYGERLTERHNALIRFERAAFENLDQAALEAQLKRVVKVRSEDET